MRALVAAVALACAVAAVPGFARTCSFEELKQDMTASVRSNPDWETANARSSAGLTLAYALEITFRQCDARVVTTVGGQGLTDQNFVIDPRSGGLLDASGSTPLATMETDVAAPIFAARQYIGSTNLVAFGAKAGIWNGAKSGSVFAYQPRGKSRQILESDYPLIGLFYLPCPDCRNGSFTLWQRVTNKRYRVLVLDWAAVSLD